MQSSSDHLRWNIFFLALGNSRNTCSSGPVLMLPSTVAINRFGPSLVTKNCSALQEQDKLRSSLAPNSHIPNMSNPTRTPGATQTRLSTMPTSASNKSRQLSHLHSQLAQLTANMSDLENLLRMTAVQAEGMRGLGGYAGAMYMLDALFPSTAEC